MLDFALDFVAENPGFYLLAVFVGIFVALLGLYIPFFALINWERLAWWKLLSATLLIAIFSALAWWGYTGFAEHTELILENIRASE